MCKDWNHYSTKKQLLIGFFLISALSLILIETTTISFLSIVSNKVENIIKQNLITQAENNAQKVISDISDLFDRKLEKSSKNFLDVIAFSMQDCYRSDFPFGKIPFYYGWKPLMKPPIKFDPKYNSWVSYSAGDINVAGYTPYQVDQFTMAINKTLYKIESVDMISKALYFENPEFISGYSGLEQNGIFGEYPAVSNDDYTQLVNWDTRTDDWYLLGKHQQKTTLYTDVYYDVWVKKKMITIVRSINDVETGQYRGTSGGDMLIETIQKSINNIAYLKNGRTILFEVDTGNIIADSDLGDTETIQIFNYTQINGIVLDNNIWTQMTTTQSSFIDIDTLNYYIYSKFLKTGNNQYLLTSFIYKDDVLNTLKPVIDNISQIINNNAIMIGCVFGVVTIFTILSVIYLTNQIVEPLQKIMDNSSKITNNIGSSNIFEGIPLNEVKSNIIETKELQTKFKNMVSQLRQKYNTTNPSGLITNSYYNKPSNSRSGRDICVVNIDEHANDITFHTSSPRPSIANSYPSAPPPPYHS